MVRGGASLVALSLVGCAKIWGFDELTPPPPPPPPVSCFTVPPCSTGCSDCSSRCVDLNADPANCGTCGTQCTSGRVCESGACICPEAYIACGGLCVDLESDPMNCGDCGIACDTGGVCNAGACTFPVTLATGQGTPGSLVVDAERIYFDTGGQIRTVALDGGDVEALAAPGSVVSLAIDGESLYYRGTTLDKIPLAGGTPTTLAPDTAAAGAIAVDETFVYWVADGTVSKVPIAGGGVTVLTTGNVYDYAIAVDAMGVYFGYSSQVWRTPLEGGSVSLVGGALSTVQDLVVQGDRVYFAGGGIGALNIDGSSGETLSAASTTQRLAVDAEHVYFFSGTSLSRVSVDGGDATVLAVDPYPKDIAIDDTSVYWTSGGVDNLSGAILKIAK